MHRSLCICGELPRIAARTRVLVVLHQLEAVKPTNTGIVAARCLTNSAVVYRGRAPAGAETMPVSSALGADVQPLLLFPLDSATPLERWRGTDRPLALVVPDGTWAQAARTRKRVAELASMPCVALPDGGTDLAWAEPTTRLRAPPRPGRLATLEAIARALGILEGPQVADALMRVYRVMTDRTLWTNGRLSADEVTGGIPAGARSHDPLHKIQASLGAPDGYPASTRCTR
jgi:DTW domain-containing protein YfiP